MPLQQVVARLSEIDANLAKKSHLPKSTVEQQHEFGPLPFEMNGVDGVKQFRKLELKGWTFKASETSLKDNVALLDSGEVAILRNVLLNPENETLVVYQKFLSKSSLYDYPLPSSDVNIFFVSKLRDTCYVTPCSKIYRKCVCIPVKDQRGFAIIPRMS
jgi:hypothetical protein